jgi:hypothetical protein
MVCLEVGFRETPSLVIQVRRDGKSDVSVAHFGPCRGKPEISLRYFGQHEGKPEVCPSSFFPCGFKLEVCLSILAYMSSSQFSVCCSGSTQIRVGGGDVQNCQF